MPKSIICLVLICTLLLGQINSTLAAKDWSSEEKLAQQIKPAVVRIYSFYYTTWTIGQVKINTYYGGMGSGAIINPDGYIITNAHVVETYTHTDNKKWENLAWELVNILVKKYNLTKQNAISIINTGMARNSKIETIHLVITPGGEELPFDLKELGSPAGEKDGKDIAIIKVEGRNLPTVMLGDSDKIRTGERIFVAGFPGAGDLGTWGSKQSELEWSWAPGTISSDKKTSAQGAPLIQVNAEGVKPGNSGGPVLNTDGQVIGLLTFGTQGGPHWAMASRTVMEFIRKAGATNEASITDKCYREGLDFYWEGYYSKALVKFEEVKRLYNKHSEANTLIAICQKNIADGNNKRYWPDYYPYIALALLLTAIVAGIVIARRKRNKQTPPSPPNCQYPPDNFHEQFHDN